MKRRIEKKIKNLNYFMDNSLNPVLENEKLPDFLKYKISI